MILRVKMIGSGMQQDPNRVPLPTYTHIHGNLTHGWALVLIPDDVHGLSAKELEHETGVEKTTEGDFYPSLCADCVSAIHDHFDTKYHEHKGEFRLELV